MPTPARPLGRVARFGVVTVLVGVAGGVAGISVWLALHLIQVVAFGLPFDTRLEAADEPSALHRLLALVSAGVLAAAAWWAIRRWAPRVVSVDQAVQGTRMSSITAPLNAGVQILAVGLGASLGKEVAPREIGAWLAQRITTRAGLTVREQRVLVACGAAAGLAAVYDVPLGGALFAVEVLLGEISFATAVPALATSAIGALVARVVVPAETLYDVPHLAFSPSLVVWAVLVGPVLGFAAVGFAALVDRLQSRRPRGWRLLVVMPLVFTGVGLVAVALPHVLGNGRAAGLAAFATGPAGWSVVLGMGVLALAKTATTAASIGSGAVGGTLTPSIAIGSTAGAALGAAWLLLWPTGAGAAGADGAAVAGFAFVGASAFLAVTMRAPFTALVLVVEFTGQGEAVLVPALLAIVGAVGVGSVMRGRGPGRARPDQSSASSGRNSPTIQSTVKPTAPITTSRRHR